MADKGKSEAEWAKAKRVCRLNAEAVRMAKELGLSPRGLMKNIPSKSQPWKAPVQVWIRDIYEAMQEKSARKKARKQAEQEKRRATAGQAHTNPIRDLADGRPGPGREREPSPAPEAPVELDESIDDIDCEEGEVEEFDDTRKDSAPDGEVIKQQGQAMLRRQRDFRAAAEYVARVLARVPAVRRIVLFGSVARPLKKEVPRFREYRRAGIKMWHECGDVDLAVWVSDLTNLRSLQHARSQALNTLLEERNIGVAHHQVEVFLMEPGTDRYLGRLCCFGECPKGKPDCLVPGCGSTGLLKQIVGFVLHGDALSAGQAVLLYDATRSLGNEPVSDDEEAPF